MSDSAATNSQSAVRRGRIAVLAAILAVFGCTTCSREPVKAPASPEPVASAPDQPEGHHRMIELLAELHRRSPDRHFYFETLTARGLSEKRKLPGSAGDWQVFLESGLAELNIGNESGGIEFITRAYEILQAPGADPAARNQVAFHLGVAHLRLGETQNCCEKRTAESCIVPIRGGGLHTRREASKSAIRYFTEILGNTQPGSYGYWSATWLINLAYMTLGGYPDEVPEAYRIPARAFEAEEDFPPFENVSADLGLDQFNLAGGVIVDDFDGDDYLDVVTSTWETDGQIRFFRNNRDGTFSDRTVPAGLEGLVSGLNLVQADYDNDGNLDFLVLRGAWLGDDGDHPNSLVHNNGDGTFTDVTFDAGLGDVHYPTQTAAWADYDLDGDLDLYVGTEIKTGVAFPSQLFRNDGDGTFTDVAEQAGVRDFRFTKAVTWGDYDGDRYPDLYTSNRGGKNRLYHNEGDGTFVDVADALGVTGPKDSFPSWFWDFDNDGALDLFVSAYNVEIGEMGAYYSGGPVRFDLPGLYQGNGKGGFRDVASDRNLTYPMLPMGSNFGDVDNDGFLDFYLGTGDTNYFTLMPNVLFLNRRGREFVNVTMASRMGHLQKGHGIAFADLDNDGDADVFAQMGGAYTGDKFANALFENPGFGNHWITVRLVGHDSNRSAIGARIRVVVDEAGETRSIYRHVNSGGSFGASPLRQMIGLGRAERIHSIEILWPATGRTQTVEGIPMDRTVRIVENRDGAEIVELARSVLGGSSG